MKLPKWTQTLQFRLVLGFAASLSVCLLAVSVWATINTRVAIANYEQDFERHQEERAGRLLQEVYDSQQDLADLQSSVQLTANLYSQRIAVVDDEGWVVADSHMMPTDRDGLYQKETQRFHGETELRFVPMEFGRDLNGKVIFFENRPAFKGWLTIRGPIRFADKPGIGSNSSGDDDPKVAFGTQSRTAIEFPEEVPGGLSVEPQLRALQNELQRAQSERVTKRLADADNDQSDNAMALLEEVPGELSVEPQLSALQNEFQGSLLISGVTAGIAGILIIAFFTRRAFAPMRDLTETATRIGKGEFDQRVNSDHRGEIGNLATSFNSMASELEAAETRRRRLTADIAHELRTPLTNIRGYLEAVKDGVVEPDEQTIETLHRETLHLSTLVEDLRLLAITDTGSLKLEKLPERLEKIVEDVVNAFSARAMESDITLVCEMEDELPVVEVDRTRITQVFHNLLDNAILHSPANSIITIRVEQESEIERVKISITDHGEGIPADEIAHIFDQFYRVDSSRTRSTGGAGLGLTIVKRLVEAHGGELTVSSDVGVGSTFSVMLPISKEV